MRVYERGFLEIDLDKLRGNVARIKKNLSVNTNVMPVIKADGYGHGARPIAVALEGVDYVWGFGVATIWEAISLRSAGVKKPILLLGNCFSKEYEIALEHDISVAVYTDEMAIEINEVAKEKKKIAKLHVKIETGMTRLGINCGEALESIIRMSRLKSCELEGILTHFAKSDEEDKVYTYLQIERFEKLLKSLKEEAINIKQIHCANSAAAIDIPEFGFDMVRTGIAIYGLSPSNEVKKDKVKLEPIMTWKSKVSAVRTVEKDTPISYGGMYVTEKSLTIAVVPIGYADGYPRSLSNKGWVLIRGNKAKILGRVCMDQFMVDITEIDGVEVEDEVVLVGNQGTEEVTVEKLSEISQRFNYEFVCEINKRMPRVYIEGKKIIDQIDYFA